MDLQLLWLREPKEFDLAEHDNCAASNNMRPLGMTTCALKSPYQGGRGVGSNGGYSTVRQGIQKASLAKARHSTQKIVVLALKSGVSFFGVAVILVEFFEIL